MKVLLVHWRYDAFGGGETYLEQLATLLESSGHVVTVMSGISRSDPARFVQGRRHVTIDEAGSIRAGLRERDAVLDTIAEIAPDVVHLHHVGGLLSPSIVRAINQAFPTVKTVHDVSLVCPLGDEMIKQCGTELCQHSFGIGCVVRGCYRVPEKGVRSLLFTHWEGRVTRQLDQLLVSTEYMRHELLRNQYPAQRITIVPLFTSINQDGAVAADAADRHRILFVGRLDRAKGGHELVEALSMLDTHRDWRVDVIGEGPAMPALEQRVRSAGLDQRIRFHGRVEASAMPGFYQRARVVVMPSMIPESFGLVGIEAMACGRPVVAFDSGGIRDWLADCDTGFLVKRGNVRALAARIEQLLADDALVEAMGQRAMRRVEQSYRPAVHMAQIQALYEAVSAAGNRRGLRRR